MKKSYVHAIPTENARIRLPGVQHGANVNPASGQQHTGGFVADPKDAMLSVVAFPQNENGDLIFQRIDDPVFGNKELLSHRERQPRTSRGAIGEFFNV